MNHKGTRRIETERLILRKFTVGDAPAAFRNWTSDADVTKYLRWTAHESIEVTRAILENWAKSSEKSDYYQWAIELKELGEPIGTISAANKDESLKILHIGYCIGSRWWHRGIVSEALAAVINYLFTEVGANRIESQHDPDNLNSGKVMLKCGMKYEGTLRQADRSNRGVVDACMYSILAKEWTRANHVIID